MDKEIIFLVEEDAESGFTAKALDHAIFTEAESLDELKMMVQDAVRCHFDEADKPPVIRLHIVKDEVIPAERAMVAAARAATGLSQATFAKLLGVSVRTLQEWEQGRKAPSGAAATLLKVAAKHPEVLKELAA